jgi:hypothetical protein
MYPSRTRGVLSILKTYNEQLTPPVDCYLSVRLAACRRQAPEVHKCLPDVLAAYAATAHAATDPVKHTLHPFGVAMAGPDSADSCRELTTRVHPGQRSRCAGLG